MLFKKYNKKRSAEYTTLFEGVFKKGDKVLDIGIGNGLIAKNIANKYKVKMYGLDVVDYNSTDIPTEIYDGKTMPYKKNQFDWSIIILTLHHCDNIGQIISEAKRVSKKGVIIYENPYIDRLNLIIVKFFDFLSNARKGVNCPYNHQSVSKWKKIFAKLGLKIDKEKIYLIKKFIILRSLRAFWVLKKLPLSKKSSLKTKSSK